jgi:hypothetical protein
MNDDTTQPLIISGVDVTHARLVDLTKLADQAEPFYQWVEKQFQEILGQPDSLDVMLKTLDEDQIKRVMSACYNASTDKNVPLLFDGIGRSYPHSKACYYFFSWLIRDAPQQRLGPLIQRIVRSTKKKRVEVEIQVITALICKYRINVKHFTWQAVREVIVDRLEGSRRSIRGQEKETIVRTALITAIQNYYSFHSNYGIYSGIEIPEKQITIGNETFDVSANLLDSQKRRLCRILVPVKTRETEGGGHAHLFTRDITSAVSTARFDNPDDYIIAVIVAKNWSDREADVIRGMVDHAAIFDLSPNDFSGFNHNEQVNLNNFISSVLSGTYKRRSG